MSSISMVEAELPPGFRFHPRDEELVCDYLMKKINNPSDNSLLLIEVDLNKSEPWDIPGSACVGGKEWYFYSKRDRKYATGIRTNRATSSGYWKATGKDRAILRKGSVVGMRKTLVFYKGRAPKGSKSDWVMHEFRLHSPPHSKEDWVLCRVFYKNREVLGKPSIGSYYDDTTSSSLPPLMDSYFSFDQTQPNLVFDDKHDDADDDYEQVPCFSIFSHNYHSNLTFPHLNNQFDNLPTKNLTTTNTATTPPFLGQLPFDCPNPILDNDLSSDKKVIKAFLNQITKMDPINSPNNVNSIVHGSPSLGEASSESYLSEVGMSNLWRNHPY